MRTDASTCLICRPQAQPQPLRRSRYSSSWTISLSLVPRLPTLPTLQTASLAMATQHRASLQQDPTLLILGALPLALVVHPTLLTLGVLHLPPAVHHTLLTLGVLLHLARGPATLPSNRAGTLLLLLRRLAAVLLLELPRHTHRLGTLLRSVGRLLRFQHAE
jgi:hypothetical protein